MMPGNMLKTMFGLFIVCDHSVETYMCDWWIIDFNRVSKFWSLTLLRDRKPEYIFRILSRAKISIYSLCDTHLIKPFGKKACQARKYLPEGRVEMPALQKNESVCYLFLLWGMFCLISCSEWSIFKPLFSSSSFRMFDQLLSLSKYLNWAKNLTLAGKETDC